MAGGLGHLTAPLKHQNILTGSLHLSIFFFIIFYYLMVEGNGQPEG
jgi:hypothetical protein